MLRLIVLAALMLGGGASAAHGQEWTNLEGTRTVQGTFLGMWGDRVVLRLTNGAKVAIEMSKLDARSRIQAEDLAEEKAAQRQRRVEELSGTSSDAATEAVAPAEVAPYAPFPDGADLETTVNHVIDQISVGHPRVIWDALPPSYQQDLQEMARQSVATTDPEMYAASLRLTEQLAKTLRTQRDFIFGHPQLAMVPSDVLQQVQEYYDPVVGLLAAYTDPETMSLENMRSGNLEPMIARFDAMAGPHLVTLLEKLSENIDGFSLTAVRDRITVNQTDEEQGTVSVENPDGEIETVAFIRVEGRWVPEPLAQDWEQNLQQAQEQNEMITSLIHSGGEDNIQLMDAVTGALAHIEQAKTQQEFNQIIDQYIAVLMQQMMQMSFGGQMGVAGGTVGGGVGGDMGNAGGNYGAPVPVYDYSAAPTGPGGGHQSSSPAGAATASGHSSSGSGPGSSGHSSSPSSGGGQGNSSGPASGHGP